MKWSSDITHGTARSASTQTPDGMHKPAMTTWSSDTARESVRSAITPLSDVTREPALHILTRSRQPSMTQSLDVTHEAEQSAMTRTSAGARAPHSRVTSRRVGTSASINPATGSKTLVTRELLTEQGSLTDSATSANTRPDKDISFVTSTQTDTELTTLGAVIRRDSNHDAKRQEESTRAARPVLDSRGHSKHQMMTSSWPMTSTHVRDATVKTASTLRPFVERQQTLVPSDVTSSSVGRTLHDKPAKFEKPARAFSPRARSVRNHSTIQRDWMAEGGTQRSFIASPAAHSKSAQVLLFLKSGQHASASTCQAMCAVFVVSFILHKNKVTSFSEGRELVLDGTDESCSTDES